MTQTLATCTSLEQAAGRAESACKVWFFFVSVLFATVLVAAVAWSHAHPYGIHWDESQYLNEIQIDGQRLRTGHLLNLVGRMSIKNFRPPAYRLLALPIVAIFGYHTTEARLISLACFVLSAFFVFLSVRRVSTPEAGAFAALVFGLSPEVISGSIFFGTDTSLYLATSAMLYFVFATWSEREHRASNWVGLGCALGLGFLAKASFILIALPVLAFWLATSRWASLKLPRLTSQRKAGALAFLIAAPWWTLNVKGAIAFAQYSRGFVATSLGAPSLATSMLWLKTVLRCLLGGGISVLIGLVLAAFIVALARKKLILSGLQMAALGACVCAGLPIIAAQLSGTSHLLRIITPSVIPLAIAVGVCASVSGWLKSRRATAVSLALFCTQAAVLIKPVVWPNKEPLDIGFANGALPSRTMIRFDQWDWRPALNLADSCQIERPEISVLGGGRTFNPPQIQFPWVVRAASTSDAKLSIPNVAWLWRFEEGPPQWQKVMDRADQSDIVITAPEYVGEVEDRKDPDDRYNAEFAERLMLDPHFQGPFLFGMGRFAPVEVAIFVKKELRCSSSAKP